MERLWSRFKDKLVKKIKDANGKFHDYSASPKIKQILLWIWIMWVMNQQKNIFLLTQLINVKKIVNTNSTEKKYDRKQKKTILKKKLLNFI